MTRRRFLVPEVVQTSATDCGPAVLASLLLGHRFPADEGALRDRCGTDVDGTATSTLALLAVEHGFDADEVMLPVDHVTRPEVGALPAIAVTVRPDGLTHFVLVWRRFGPVVQVMDPAVGRRWVTERRLRAELFVHRHVVPAAAWRAYAGTEEPIATLRARLAEIGLDPGESDHHIRAALDDPTWHTMARLDAATRAVRVLAGDRQVLSRDRGRTLQAILARTEDDLGLPGHLWPVLPTDGSTATAVEPTGGASSNDDDEEVWLQGAVLVKAPLSAPPTLAPGSTAAQHAEPVQLPRESRRPTGWRGAQRLLAQVTSEGGPRARWVAALAAGAGLAGVAEVLALRTVVERPGGGVFIALLVALVSTLLTVALQAKAQAVGRRLDLGLRDAIIGRLPTIADRYVATRPASDLTERMHRLHRIGDLPERVALAIAATTQAIACGAVIVWTVPDTVGPVIVLLVAGPALTALAQPGAVERELRAQTLAGTLGQSLTDVLVGLETVRAHEAEAALTFQHDALLRSWEAASRARHRWAATTTGLARATSLAAAAGVLTVVVRRGNDQTTVLLAGFLAVLAAFALDAATAAVRSLPSGLATTRRLVEPLDAPQESPSNQVLPGPGPGVTLEFQAVALQAGGIDVLCDIDLNIGPGQRVAVVGPSGAGKSTLLAVVLGLVDPARGRVLVDGRPIAEVRDGFRRATAWIDPGVALWNRSLGANVIYGRASPTAGEVVGAADIAGLGPVLAVRPEGFASEIGYGGHILSGGEGQRVRIARALLRRDVRLVVADEALRGLDRSARHNLLQGALRSWPDATVLWATHDLTEASGFDVVVVVEGGRVVEAGPPSELGPCSRFAALAAAQADLEQNGWAAGGWRRVCVTRGHGEARRDRSIVSVGPDALSVSGPDRAQEGVASPKHTFATPSTAEDDGPNPAAPTLRRRVPLVGDLPLRPGRRDAAVESLSETPDELPPPWPVIGEDIDVIGDLRRSGVARVLIAAAVLSAAAVAATVAGFAVVGHLAFSGGHWLTRWALLGLLASAALGGHLIATGDASATGARVVRRRLLAASCRANGGDATRVGPERVATALDLDALDRASISAGLLGVEGVLELAAAATLLLVGTAPAILITLFAAGVLLAVWAVGGVRRSQAAVAESRRDLSAATTEVVLEHRTRLVQGRRDGDEHDLAALTTTYGRQRAQLDRWTLLVGSVLPGTWLVCAIAVTVATVGDVDPVHLAATLGTILLASSGFQVVGAGVREATEGLVAATSIRQRLATARRATRMPHADVVSGAPAAGDELVALRGASLAVDDAVGHARTILRDVDLVVSRGDRILLEGLSGSGKSTLVSALAGLHRPSAGHLSLGTLASDEGDGAAGDRRSVRVVMVPQFHRNHVFTGTLAFNVLMGSTWPAAEPDELRAETLCRSLGLGPLIDLMPSGMSQVVGETGWQLSHGERSRLYVARALAQDPDVLLLDESFGALDPETMTTCVRAVERRCETLVLVAHP